MNDLDYERWRGRVDERLLILKEGLDDIPEHIDNLGDRLEGVIMSHAHDDRDSFAKHDSRLTKLEHANIKVGVVAAAVATAATIAATAAARAFFG